MYRPPRPLGAGFERLEDRTLPTAFGIPWADPGHLTLSFAPDGTPTPLGPSTAHQALGAATPTAVWQREVLRAFQTWAAETNINIGLVRDGGQALGTRGAVQGDTRFGDVRVAAAPLSAGALASASPFSWTGTTFAGDMVFSSSRPFRAGGSASAFDIYSIALHEAGHALGLDHSDAPGSALADGYGLRPGLTADDVAAIRAIYGVRAPDKYDGAGGNNSTGRAAWMDPAGIVGRFVADGDLSTTADVDFYRFSVLPVVSLTGVSVRLQAAGLSLLTPSVTVYNSAGKVVASAVTTDPLNNDLILRFTPGLFGGMYYLKVDGARPDAFGVGSYRVTVDTIAGNVPVPLLSSLLNPVTDALNDTLATATDLSLDGPPPDRRFDATHRAAISSSSDVDNYRVRAPAASGSAPLNLNVMVWGLDAAPLSPRVRVFDAAGNPVAFQVLANEAGLFSVQVLGVRPGADYYVQVSSRTPGGTGRYFLGADFNQLAPTTYDGLTSDTLNPGATTTGTFTVAEAGVFQFALAARTLAPGGGGVTMTVLDAAGRVVFTLDATAGQPGATAVKYLAAGSYTVRYDYRGVSGAPAAPLRFDLFLLQLSGGVGPYATATTAAPDGTVEPDESPRYAYEGSSDTRPDGYWYYF
jgi:hypothetical protein